MMNHWVILAVIMALCWGCSESPNQPAEPEENTGQTVTTATAPNNSRSGYGGWIFFRQ